MAACETCIRGRDTAEHFLPSRHRPEAREYATLHQACHWGDLPAVKRLVQGYSADIYLPTKSGQSALQVAEAEGHAPVVKYLLGKAKAAPKPAAGSYNAATDRKRISATRTDGIDEPDMPLGAVKHVTLKLGADGGGVGGILCGAALVYGKVYQLATSCLCHKSLAFVFSYQVLQLKHSEILT